MQKIEDIEKEVEKLLHEDSLAEEVKLGTRFKPLF